MALGGKENKMGMNKAAERLLRNIKHSEKELIKKELELRNQKARLKLLRRQK
jgi:hypothetical protein